MPTIPQWVLAHPRLAPQSFPYQAERVRKKKKEKRCDCHYGEGREGVDVSEIYLL
jgi:hypothetical protein